MLGYLSLLIGGAMLVTLPLSFALCGQTPTVEMVALRVMLKSIGVAAATGIGLLIA